MNSKVEEYFKKQEKEQKEVLKKIRGLVRKIAPEAEEGMSYGAPAFKLNGRQIVYAGFKKHIGLYPEPETIERFKEELKNYETSKGAIKFYLDQPIPYDLIERIVREKFDLN